MASHCELGCGVSFLSVGVGPEPSVQATLPLWICPCTSEFEWCGLDTQTRPHSRRWLEPKKKGTRSNPFPKDVPKNLKTSQMKLRAWPVPSRGANTVINFSYPVITDSKFCCGGFNFFSPFSNPSLSSASSSPGGKDMGQKTQNRMPSGPGNPIFLSSNENPWISSTPPRTHRWLDDLLIYLWRTPFIGVIFYLLICRYELEKYST